MVAKPATRREFLIRAAALPVCAAALGPALAGSAAAAAAQSPAPRPSTGALKVAINAYSFSKLLNDNIKGRGAGITLIQALEFAAKCKAEGFDPTGYFFPNYPERPSESYVKELKTRAADLGIGISGTG